MSRTFLCRFSLIAAVFSLLPAVAPAAAPVPAPKAMFATGGPDSFGYRYVDSQESGGPSITMWENIGTTGTQIFGANTDDSVSGALSIGFTFPYYGTDYTSFYCSSNGNIHFSSPSLTYPGQQLPNSGLPNTMIALLWADLHTGPDGNVRYSSNSTRLIVQWTSCEYYPSGNDQTFTMQIRIEPSGTIYLLYETMSGLTTTNSTSVGIENSSGTVGLSYSFNQNPNTTPSGRVVRFADNTDPNPPTNLSQAAVAGGPNAAIGFVSDNTVYFRGQATDPDSNDTIGVEAEILPAASPFQPAVTGQLARTAPSALVAQGQVAEAQYTFTGAPFGEGDYHWRVRTIDSNGGVSTWVVFNAANVHFTVDLTPPSLVGEPLIPPQNASVGIIPPASDVLFKWGDATDTGPPGTISYHVQVSASPGFASTLADEVLTGHEITTVLSLSPNPYYWRVRAFDPAGNPGPFIVPISFSVSVQDGINHGGGDCNISAGAMPGPLIPAVLAALVLAFGWCRRRR